VSAVRLPEATKILSLGTMISGTYEIFRSYYYSGGFDLWVFRELAFCEAFTKAK
jgi:hypothetical protein